MMLHGYIDSITLLRFRGSDLICMKQEHKSCVSKMNHTSYIYMYTICDYTSHHEDVRIIQSAALTRHAVQRWRDISEGRTTSTPGVKE
jgi:hypothetical protein